MKLSSPRRFTAFKLLIGVSLLIFCISLLTPYPAQLIEAFKSSPPTPNQPEIPSREPISANQQEPPAPPIQTNSNVEYQSWQPNLLISPPQVQYPPFPPVLPTRPSDSALYNVYDLARGLNLKTALNFTPGGSAATDRDKKSNYQMTLSLDIKQPKATKSAQELQRLNHHLPKIFTQFPTLIEQAKVSPYYGQLYSLKQTEIRKNLASLTKLLTRHNYYDLETILEITHPESNRKALWIQSEMDVVSDGSDGDRLAKMPEKILNSSFYQPSTSYRWKKATNKPNPLLSPWQKRLDAAKKELKTAKGADKTAISKRIDHAERVIYELKNYSYLIAEYDPFIVIPLGIVKQQSAFSPQFGDYAVVIAGNKIYPAIVGDAGPRYKIGEASIRLAREINPKANSYSRPESDLKITYLVFPGTAETQAGPINYAELQNKCMSLLQEIGGISPQYQLHDWQDLLAPPAPKENKETAPPKDKATDSKPSTDNKPVTETKDATTAASPTKPN